MVGLRSSVEPSTACESIAVTVESRCSGEIDPWVWFVKEKDFDCATSTAWNIKERSMIEARLEGGEYDGAQDEMEVDRPPNLVGAYVCPECKSVHIHPYFEVRGLTEVKVIRYLFVRMDDFGALYRFGEGVDEGPSGPGVPEPIEEPVREREPELVPAIH